MAVAVGTSGWHYPTGHGTWNGIFYPAPRPRGFDELAYYAEHFETVEVNSTFYRMPEAPMSQAWLRRTPPSFTFAVKLFQKFTHPDMYLAAHGAKDWDVSAADLDQFRLGIAPMAEAGRLEAVLLQFPPSVHADADTRAYLDWLCGALAAYPLAVELRHQSWNAEAAATEAILSRHGATWAMTDEPRVAGVPHQAWPAPADGARRSPLYVRLHGRNAAAWWEHEHAEERYDYLYSPAELQPFATEVRRQARPGRRVVVYFNNHHSAKAVANAAELTEALGEPVRGEYPREMVHRYPALAGVVAVAGLPI